MTTLIDWFEGGAGQGWGHLLQHMLGSGDYNEKFGHFSLRNLSEYTKKFPNIKVYDLTPAPPTTQSIKVVIVVTYNYYVKT